MFEICTHPFKRTDGIFERIPFVEMESSKLIKLIIPQICKMVVCHMVVLFWGVGDHRGASNEGLPNVPKVFDYKPMKVAPWSKI